MAWRPRAARGSTSLSEAARPEIDKERISSGDHGDSAWRTKKRVAKAVCHLTDRRSAASESADRSRPCSRSMPPDGNPGQSNRAVVGLLQLLPKQLSSVREKFGPAWFSVARYDDANVPIALLEGGDSTRPTVEIGLARVAHRGGR
jgi:hypothetical protein